ncbi:hypothetical protein [Atribacter laminatus]|uniref:hypothetical protein n=1 Tax=Atribacter laminatus TaxID=2847778 RepID=UPI001C405BC8|nr:hypothetical protein [Atribacter laminatus]
MNFLLLRHCEESNRFLVGRRGNLIRYLCHSEESGVFAGRRKNLIIFNTTIQHIIKNES